MAPPDTTPARPHAGAAARHDVAEQPSTRLLIVFAHPAAHISQVNQALAAAARTLPFVKVHDLYARYPTLFVRTRDEQQLLLAHQTIVLQHPFYWYSVPALLKEWIDLVLEYGWAYGRGGTRLAGKTWTHAISTGGAAEAYAADGHNRFPIEEFMRPLEQTAVLCGMRWQPPFISHRGRALAPAELQAHAQRYRDWLIALDAQHAAEVVPGPLTPGQAR